MREMKNGITAEIHPGQPGAPMVPVIPLQLKKIMSMMDSALPNPDLVSYYALENERKLYLDTEVDNNILTIQRMILRFNIEDKGKNVDEHKPIYLYIYSPGGDVDVMWSLIDAIDLSETPVITVNMGLAASAAGLIFLAGHRRVMLRRSKIVIHEGSARLQGDAVKVMDASESYKKMVKQMQEFILSRTSITSAALSKQKCHDWEINAEYALEHGACDMIAESIDDII